MSAALGEAKTTNGSKREERGSDVVDFATVESLQSGDIVLFDRDCVKMGVPLGWAVCRFAKWVAEYDHVALVHRIGDGEVTATTQSATPKRDDVASKIHLIEANFNGVVERPILERIQRPHNIRMTARKLEGLAPEQRASLDRAVAELSRQLTTQPATYKRNLSHFFATALQPPDKSEAVSTTHLLHLKRQLANELRRHGPVPSSPRDGKSIRHSHDQPQHSPFYTTDLFFKAASVRQGRRLEQEIAFLESLERELKQRQATRQAAAIMGVNESGDAHGYFCSELVATAWQRAKLIGEFPPATTFGANDFSAASASSSADDLRRRFPPLLPSGVLLGPEECVKGAKPALQTPEGGGHAPLRPGFTVDRGDIIDGTVAPAGAPTACADAGNNLLCTFSDGARVLAPPHTPLSARLAQRTLRSQRRGTIVSTPPAATEGGRATNPNVPLPRPAELLFGPSLTAVPDAEGYARGSSIATAESGLQLVVVQRGRVRCRDACDGRAERIYYPGDVIALELVCEALHLAAVDPTAIVREAPSLVADADATEVARIPFSSLVDIAERDASIRFRVAQYCSLVDASRRDVLWRGLRPAELDTERFQEVAGLDETVMSPPQLTVAQVLSLAPPVDPTRSPSFTLSSVLRLVAAAELIRLSPRSCAIAPLVYRLAALTPDELGQGTLCLDELNAALQVAYRSERGTVQRSPFAFVVEPAKSTSKGSGPAPFHPYDRVTPEDFLAKLQSGIIRVPDFVLDDFIGIQHAVFDRTEPVRIASHAHEASKATGGENAAVFRALDDLKEVFVPLDRSPSAAKRIAGRLWKAAAVATLTSVVLFPLEYVQLHRQIVGKQFAAKVTLRQLVANAAYVYRSGAMRMGVLRAATASSVHGALLYALAPYWDNVVSATESQGNLPHERLAALTVIALCGTIASVMTYPYEVLRIMHLANTPAMPTESVTGTATTRGLRSQVLAKHGVRGLWRGVAVATLCLTPYMGASHWLYYHEAVLPLWLRRAYCQSGLLDEPTADAWFAVEQRAAIGWRMGIVGTAVFSHLVVTYPFDTLRLAAIGRGVNVRTAIGLEWAAADRRAIRFVRRLYSGFGLGLMRVVPAAVVAYNAFGMAVSRSSARD